MFRAGCFGIHTDRLMAIVATTILLAAAPLSIAPGQQQETRSTGRAKKIEPPKRSNTYKPTVILKPGERPEIEFDSPIFHFGSVRGGIDVVHDFWFTNTGNGTLEILDVHPGCGCTTTSEHVRVVKPGERGKIPVKMATKKLANAINKNVAVTTNALDAGARVMLHLKGDVWRALEVRPPQAGFGRINSEAITKEYPELKYTIIINVEEPVALTNARSTDPVFKPELHAIEAGKKFELIVTLDKSERTGPIGGKIEIDTGLDYEPTLIIPVSVYIMDYVDVSPRQLYVIPKRTQEILKNIYVINNGKEQIAVSDVKVSTPLVKVSLSESKPGKVHKIRVEIPADYVVPPGGDKITFKTTHPKAPQLTVPITLYTPKPKGLAATRVRVKTKPVNEKGSGK